MNSLKCANCGLVNFVTDATCKRCGNALTDHQATDEADDEHRSDEHRSEKHRSVAKRVLATFALACLSLLLCYASLIRTSDPITFAQRQTVNRAIDLIGQKGFAREAFVLHSAANYRLTDNWWNRWVGHADAYAATNFPFEVVTLYPDFFSVPIDDVERAIILLHEARHLLGKGEPAAFADVWRSKKQLGWTIDTHGHTHVWKSVREFTTHYAPKLFQCGLEGQADCME
jgi:transcription initiation factor TFIIIB Brf1 subunit/transcription initiation factor TFIIB